MYRNFSFHMTKKSQKKDTLAKLEKFSILPCRDHLSKKKVQDSFEFLSYLGYISLGKACSSSNRASFIPISRISTNLRHQLYNNTRQGQGRELWGTIECHHFSGFPVGILTPPAWAAWPRRSGLSWPSEPWCQTQKLATIWWASLTTYTAKKARIIGKFQA